MNAVGRAGISRHLSFLFFLFFFLFPFVSFSPFGTPFKIIGNEILVSLISAQWYTLQKRESIKIAEQLDKRTRSLVASFLEEVTEAKAVPPSK